ncbi:hypothetical protein [Leuconostoc citreum]
MQVNIFDYYDKQTRTLIQSLKTVNIKRKNIFVHYDGVLPKGAINPFAYFIGINEGDENDSGLFFDQVEVPEFYAIRHVDGDSANIEYLKNVVGKINYREDGYRLVHSVDWYAAQNLQSIVKKDHYTSAGQHYATTYFNPAGSYKKSYYDSAGKLVIIEDLVNKNIRLYQGKAMHHFENLTQFFLYFLKVAKISISNIYINSLSFPLFIARQIDKNQTTTLFWQEALGQEVPGNMKHELNNPNTLKQVIFMSENQLSQVEKKFPATSVSLSYLSPIGEFVRVSHYRMNAFILTNSDNIHGLRDILINLPELKITVAAYTNMSTKLLHMAEEFPNIRLIPSIDPDELEIELEQSDIYLDINYGLKVDHILERAYQQNMIIFSYQDVMKKGEKSIVFNDTRDLCNNLSYILNDRTSWQRLLTNMIEKDGRLSNIHDYQKILGQK